MLGKESPLVRYVAYLLVVLLSPIVFVGVPVRIAFNEWFVEWEYSKKDFPRDRYGMQYQERISLAKLGLRAVLSDEAMEEFKRAKLPNGRPAFNPREIKHMEDVKKILSIFFPLVYGSVFLWITALVLTGSLRNVGKALVMGSVFSLLLTTAVAVFSKTNYKLAFELFHNLLFDPYSWKFRPWDTLIRIYPLKFWYDATMLVAVLALGLCLLSLSVGLFLLRYRRSS